VTCNNSTLIKGDPVKEIIKLKVEAGQELQIHGSGNLARTLIQHDLIDEYRVLVHPVLLGKGRTLLADGATPAVVQRQLRHSDARITLGIYGHVIGNQQRDAVENRSARIEQFAVN